MGCRRGCPADVIVALARRAISHLPPGLLETCTDDYDGLFTIEAKRNEAGLQQAAQHLGLPLIFLSVEALCAVSADLTIRSARVEEAVGVPAVAEAAALVGAGAGARLIVPRLSDGGATCAIAAGWS